MLTRQSDTIIWPYLRLPERCYGSINCEQLNLLMYRPVLDTLFDLLLFGISAQVRGW
jgi:hypothetical protein